MVVWFPDPPGNQNQTANMATAFEARVIQLEGTSSCSEKGTQEPEEAGGVLGPE